MSINDLNKDLYSSNSEKISAHAHESSDYDPMISSEQKVNPFSQEEKWKEEQRGLTPGKKKLIAGGLFVLAVISFIVGGTLFYLKWSKESFYQERVEISFEGPKEVDSTQPVKYIIHYDNNNRAVLKNAIIKLNYSDNFKPAATTTTDNLNLRNLGPTSSEIFIGDIGSMSKKTYELKGIFYAPKDTPVFLHANLDFNSTNGKKSFTMETQIGVNIVVAPVILSIVAPQQAANEDKIEYNIDYRNLDTKVMNNVQIRVEFPQGFKMSNADPRPSEKDSYWYAGNLESNQGGKIKIQGNLYGNSGDSKNIVVSLGHVGDDSNFIVFSKQEFSTKVVSPVLTIKQRVEGAGDNIVNAGDTLKYIISYQNTGNTGLRNAIISVEIKGKILDFSKIKIDRGSFNGETGMLTWKASDVPGLANINPKTEGTVGFEVPVKDVIPVESKIDKNFIIYSFAKIDSPDIPTPIDSNKIIGSNTLELKLASKVILDANVYYKDAKIENSGPFPMEIGKETTLSIRWSLLNVSNDISEAKIISSLPSGVRWTGKIYPLNEKISYNERTNQITWDIGNLASGVGILDPQREVAFQIGLTPQANQGSLNSVIFINNSVFTGKDIFIDRVTAVSYKELDGQRLKN